MRMGAMLLLHVLSLGPGTVTGVVIVTQDAKVELSGQVLLTACLGGAMTPNSISIHHFLFKKL